MSQQVPLPPVPQPRNVYVNCHHKVLAKASNKVRSGIIERYTYKTDNGKLLSSTLLDKNSNADSVCLKSVSAPQSRGNLQANIPSVSRTTIIKTNVNKNHHQNVTMLKLGNSSREENDDNKVRTEHCDSTTDIIENMEKETMNILQHEIKLFIDDDYYERYRKCSPSNPSNEDMLKRLTFPQESNDIDSDSDCQIIDVKLSEHSHISNYKDRYPVSQDEALTQNSDNNLVAIDNLISEESPNTKVLSWISTKPEIHVISDSEEENDSKTFLSDEININKTAKEIDIDTKLKPKVIESGDSSSLVLPSDDIKSDLLFVSKINFSSKDSVGLINAKYRSARNNFSPAKKQHMISNAEEITQSNISIRPESPEMCSSPHLSKSSPKSILGNRLEVTPPKVQNSNVQIQKVNSHLSPDSMKTEFYSYLKINTNPMAQKAETVAQNRRSTRVKNLILQIEKNKELKNENDINNKDKSNDVRKKFMKYSKFKIVFPPPPIQHNKISDFNQSIEAYFKKEKIKFPNLKKSDSAQDNEDQTNKTEIPQSIKYRTNALVSINKNKKIYTKKLLNQSLKNMTKEVRYNSQLFGDKKLRRLRYSPNRILRSTPVRKTRTYREDSKMWNIKMLKAKKAKLKAKITEKHIKIATQKTKQESDKPKIKIKRPESTSTDKLDTSTLICVPAQDKQPSLPVILARKLSVALNRPVEKIEYYEKNSTVKTDICPSAKTHLGTEVVYPRKLVEDKMSNEFTPYSPMFRPETEKRIRKFCQSTPIYKSESDKELEFFTSSQNNEKLKENSNNLRNNSVSPPFLGFTSDESKISGNNTQFSVIEKLNPEKTNFVSEVQENCQVQADAQMPDVISISSGNDTSLEEDSNSETSSIQEEPQITVQEVIDTTLIESGNPNYIPLNQNIKAKSFHKSLMQSCVKRKSALVDTTRSTLIELSDSDSSMSTPKTCKGAVSKRSQTHEIDINKNNGAVFNTYYVNGILIIVQEQLITFWKQTALGNILGVQNMWLPHGSIQRIILDPGCVNRRSSEMVLSCDNSVAYVELWTKEHKCMYRECPIADVFATVYFHKGYGLPDKKVIQLENIKGYGDDVRFAVIKNSREIIVSWCDTFAKPVKTLVRSYQLAADFQTVSSIKEMEFVSHYISSLLNIHDCDDLVLGAGNEQISVWNLRHGYLVTTLSLSETSVQSPSESKTICLYAQCDTGFLFLIQQTEVGILRLVAVNGMTQEWKQLHSYQVPDSYNKLLGVIVESGVLMTCYTNGFLCWNMHSGDVLAEIDTPNELIVLPSNKYLVAIDNYQVTVQHIMSYILTHDW